MKTTYPSHRCYDFPRPAFPRSVFPIRDTLGNYHAVCYGPIYALGRIGSRVACCVHPGTREEFLCVIPKRWLHMAMPRGEMENYCRGQQEADEADT